MDFGLSEQQHDVQNLAREIFGDLVSPEKLSQYDANQAQRFDADLWAKLAETGLLGVAIDEQYGGMGFGFFELALLVEEAGRRIAPVPVISHLVSAVLPIQKFGSDAQKQQFLPAAVSGKGMLTSALMEAGNEDPCDPQLTVASIDGDGLRISGQKLCVPFAEQASAILLSAKLGDEVVAVLLDPRAEGVSLTPMRVTNYEPQYSLQLDNVVIAGADILGQKNQGREILRWATERSTAAVCAHQLGATDTAMRMTASYSAERQQFGVPIATFQAVGHRAANCFIDVECLRLNTYQALGRLAANLDASNEVHIAKIWAGDVGHRVSYASQHLHGGTGIDRDYPLWRYCTWLRHNEMQLGGSAKNLALLGKRIAAGEAFCA